jgi:cytosine/adenosine deaminase-related metal-dependent hydrolase
MSLAASNAATSRRQPRKRTRPSTPSDAARALGIEEETGTIAAGRRADVVVWSADPLSSYAVAERVYMDGALIYERGADRAAGHRGVAHDHRERHRDGA